MGILEELKGFVPEAEKTGFDLIEDRSLKCNINHARIQPSTWVDTVGEPVLAIEAEVVDHASLSGRRLWKRFNLKNPNSVKKLANQLFACGIEFLPEIEEGMSEEGYQATLETSIEKASEEFVRTIIKARAWIWKREEGDTQQWIIQGKWQEKAEAGTPAF